jgi:phosphate:Na+ symporter
MQFLGSAALYLAGLSFFFTGVSGVSENLRLMSGQRFRQLLGKATDHPFAACLLGVAMGAATQSTSVAGFILTGMVASGMLALRRALLVLSWAGMGTALLVFVAALDLQLPVLLLIGLSGLALAFRLWSHWKPGFAGLLSIGLLLFGLETMKQAFQPLSSIAGAVSTGRFLDAYPYAAFLGGAALRSVIHSSSAVAAIAITLSKGSKLGDFPAMMMIAGLGLGSAIATTLLTSHMQGLPRQIALHQALINAGGGLLLAALLSVEHVSHLPMLLALVHRGSASLPGRLALTYLLLNVGIVLVGTATLPWAPRLLAALSPPTAEQDLSLPRYVNPDCLNSPETALDLVAMEQLRVVQVLVEYMKYARGDRSVKLGSLHKAAQTLSGEIRPFLGMLVKEPIPASLAARCLAFQRKEDTLSSLEENVFLFAETVGARASSAEMATSLTEALDLLVMTAADALQSQAAGDVRLLLDLTSDRGNMMEELRRGLRPDERNALEDVSALHYASTLFERNVWLLRQLGLWMQEDAAAAR